MADCRSGCDRIFLLFCSGKRLAKRLFFGAGIAISAANFVVDLYPAWQVPAGYVYLALLIWIIIDNRDCLKNYRIKDWMLAGGFFVFMISIIGMYLYNYMDYMTAIMNTVYPGGRTYYGGFSIDKLCGYLISLTTPYTDFTNPSEMGCFYGLFPFSVIVFAYALIQKKEKFINVVFVDPGSDHGILLYNTVTPHNCKTDITDIFNAKTCSGCFGVFKCSYACSSTFRVKRS